ncbi:hypothetical protein [Gluconobacter wancherniae]|uniref:hypothetical protein n=1 Tax=Gluconobacter wancherniae TaxID=1307955 RepID=UPI001B8B7011|nr:hypothetical protein [Gluconobacter wancherniae]MBS1088180.1 hypothetical protein [Gluconobacter wancherniae]
MTRDLDQNMSAAIWVQHMAETLRELARENRDKRWGRALATDDVRMMRLQGRFVGGEA